MGLTDKIGVEKIECGWMADEISKTAGGTFSKQYFSDKIENIYLQEKYVEDAAVIFNWKTL